MENICGMAFVTEVSVGHEIFYILVIGVTIQSMEKVSINVFSDINTNDMKLMSWPSLFI